MVNFMVISEYSGAPVPGDRVKIGMGPLYPLERVRALAKDPQHCGCGQEGVQKMS